MTPSTHTHTPAPDTRTASPEAPAVAPPADTDAALAPPTAPHQRARHHGNLRAALVEAGITMLESGDPFSLRAAARRVGVSPTAAYRHFENKERLEAAMAAHGFRDLRARLARAAVAPGDDDLLVALALATIGYARANPAMYRLMFAQPCGEDDDRLTASAALLAFVEQCVHGALPDASAVDLATAGWAMTHGFAMLAISGKVASPSTGNVDDAVRRAFAAAFQGH